MSSLLKHVMEKLRNLMSFVITIMLLDVIQMDPSQLIVEKTLIVTDVNIGLIKLMELLILRINYVLPIKKMKKVLK